MWPLSFFTSPPQMALGTQCRWGKGGSVRMLCLARESFSPSSSPSQTPQLPSSPSHPGQSHWDLFWCQEGVVLGCQRPHISDSSPLFILGTFIDCKEALSDPVATAAEFNPEAAVSGDDRLRELAPAEAACEDSVDRGAVRPELSPSLLLMPGCPSGSRPHLSEGLRGSGPRLHWTHTTKTLYPPMGLCLVQGPAWP